MDAIEIPALAALVTHQREQSFVSERVNKLNHEEGVAGGLLVHQLRQRSRTRQVERRRNSTPTSYPAGSIGDLITGYRASDEFKRLSEGTQSNYEVHMRRFEAHDTWGMVAVRDLAPITVQTARDAMKETAVMANQMLSVGRTIWDWAIPLDLAKFNPFDKVRDFDIPDRGHVPWPSWVIDHVRTHAWPDLVRMMRLGVITCQRGSNLIRMGPEHRDRNGV
jgi:hypothetical protein